MNNIVMLVLWLSMEPAQPPAFQVLGVAETVKQCEVARTQVEKANAAAKGRLKCMQILTPLVDASGAL